VGGLLPSAKYRSEHEAEVFLCVHRTSDFLIPVHKFIKNILADTGIKYTLLEVPGYGHEGPLWRKNPVEFSQKIFR
jgi:enterochelin esterase-like enzyme